MNKQAYYALAAALAKHFNQPLDSVLRGESFALKAPEAALLGENIQQRSDFLKQINMIQVAHTKGQKLFGATEKGVTGRKQTGRNLANLDHTQNGFELAETDSGIIVPWALLCHGHYSIPSLFSKIALLSFIANISKTKLH